MSGGGRRRRGSGGHPARVAQRRERDAARRSPGPADLARRIARGAAEMDSALDAELWGSQLLGSFRPTRYSLTLAEGMQIDPVLELGTPLVEQFAVLDEPGAAIGLHVIAELDDGELGMRAGELIEGPLVRRLPPWAADVGRAQITGAAVMRDETFDDARTVLLESRHPDGQTLAIGVLIDHNLGRMAKDVLLADSLDSVEETVRTQPVEHGIEIVFERIAPGVAAGLIADAIQTTDMTWDPPVDEDYWFGRAIALHRADCTSSVVLPADPEQLSDAEAQALHEAFLASPESAGVAADSDEAWGAQLAIDFTGSYLADDPLRWSPSVAELFMLDWVPRKVMASDEMLGVLPTALDAWVRFAARRRGIDERALALTRETIEEFADEMRQAADDPDVGGPSKQFLRAAQQAGVDLEDAEALTSFIAGWNARSALEEPALADIAGPTGARARRAARSDEILQIKISLKGVSKPPVWRRLRLPASTPLDAVHEIIQIAFGWVGYHLHAFETDGAQFGPVDPDLDLDVEDEREVALGDLVAEPGDRVTYTYDFGDDWRHEIRLEQVLDLGELGVAASAPPMLVAGRGACPPEDCGGPWGYEELKGTLADSESPRHEELCEWLGRSPGDRFDPAAVDLDAARAALAARTRTPRANRTM